MTLFMETKRLVTPEEAKQLAVIARRAQCVFWRKSRRNHVYKGWFEGPGLSSAAEEQRETFVKAEIAALGIRYPVDD